MKGKAKVDFEPKFSKHRSQSLSLGNKVHPRDFKAFTEKLNFTFILYFYCIYFVFATLSSCRVIFSLWPNLKKNSWDICLSQHRKKYNPKMSEPKCFHNEQMQSPPVL